MKEIGMERGVRSRMPEILNIWCLNVMKMTPDTSRAFLLALNNFFLIKNYIPSTFLLLSYSHCSPKFPGFSSYPGRLPGIKIFSIQFTCRMVKSESFPTISKLGDLSMGVRFIVFNFNMLKTDWCCRRVFRFAGWTSCN